MLSPQVSALELQRIYPQFLGRIRGDLRLTSEEQGLAAQADPITWAQWGVSVLAGDELIAYPMRSDMPKTLRGPALTFFAGEVEINGEPAVDFRQGELARRVDAMYTSRNPSMHQRLERFSRTTADFLLTVGGPPV
jgi:hypothetical protein